MGEQARINITGSRPGNQSRLCLDRDGDVSRGRDRESQRGIGSVDRSQRSRERVRRGRPRCVILGGQKVPGRTPQAGVVPPSRTVPVAPTPSRPTVAEPVPTIRSPLVVTVDFGSAPATVALDEMMVSTLLVPTRVAAEAEVVTSPVSGVSSSVGVEDPTIVMELSGLLIDTIPLATGAPVRVLAATSDQ